MALPHSPEARRWAEALGLQPHPEGGWYRETYRATDVLAASALPERFGGERCVSTSIYYLLEAGQRSALHRIRSDELWHFHAGGGLVIHVLDEDARSYEQLHLGLALGRGDAPQQVVPAGRWFGAEPVRGAEWCLVGCTVAPGFVFEDFELADTETLVARFPLHEAVVRRFAR